MLLSAHCFWPSCPVLIFANLVLLLPFYLLALMATPVWALAEFRSDTWNVDMPSASQTLFMGGPIRINEMPVAFAVIILESFLMCYCDFMYPRHFSKTNQILEKLGVSAIDWQL